MNTTSSPKPSSETNKSTTFLWVNQSAGAPTYNAGERKSIRSHVRKGVLTQKHQTKLQKREGEPKWRTLAPQSVDQKPSEEAYDFEVVTGRFPQIIPIYPKKRQRLTLNLLLKTLCTPTSLIPMNARQLSSNLPAGRKFRNSSTR